MPAPPSPDLEACAACGRPLCDHTTYTKGCPPGWGVNLSSRFRPSGTEFVPRKDTT